MREIRLLMKYGQKFPQNAPTPPGPRVVLPSSAGEAGFIIVPGVSPFVELEPAGGGQEGSGEGRGTSNRGDFRSVVERRKGLRILRDFALVRCGEHFAWALSIQERFFKKPRRVKTGGKKYCGYFVIVRRKQKTARCQRCGKRFWLSGVGVLAQSDEHEKLRKLISTYRGWRGKGRDLNPLGDLDAHVVRRDNLDETAAAGRPGNPRHTWRTSARVIQKI